MSYTIRASKTSKLRNRKARKTTPWLNPVVVVSKTDGSIRLCIDKRYGNNAIERTRYPTPAVDNIKIKLKGAKIFTIFTKLDVKTSFHRI